MTEILLTKMETLYSMRCCFCDLRRWWDSSCFVPVLWIPDFDGDIRIITERFSCLHRPLEIRCGCEGENVLPCEICLRGRGNSCSMISEYVETQMLFKISKPVEKVFEGIRCIISDLYLYSPSYRGIHGKVQQRFCQICLPGDEIEFPME